MPENLFTQLFGSSFSDNEPAEEFLYAEDFIGAVVTLDNDEFWTLEKFAISPYYEEELQGIQRAYIVALDGSCSDWVLPIELYVCDNWYEFPEVASHYFRSAA